MPTIRVFFLIVIVSACTVLGVYAQPPSELPGSRDHSVVSRFKGAVLYNTSSENFAALRIPLGPGQFKESTLQFDNAVSVEGRISAYYYVQPKGIEPLEVIRNYKTALQQAGFKELYACALHECERALLPEHYRHELLSPRRWNQQRIDPGGGSSPRELRYWSGKATHNGADMYVIVWVTEATSVWNAVTTSVVVVEPKPMEEGQVVASLERIRGSLQAEGKIALYGLYFDTGKAEIKPTSAPQLDEMAKLLKSDSALQVFIVGHTDNQGTLATNIQLSQQRAEAVVAALVGQYGVDAKRVSARGVANFAPLASNATETGRAKNRRVELVLQ